MKKTSISSPDRIFNSWQGFYCNFMWQYLDILREKAQKKLFYKALRGKNTCISSPDRIFNSWQGFYCSFMWQHFQFSSKISKTFFFRSQNPDNLRGFCPPNRKWRLLLRFYVTIFGHFKGKRPKKFF